MATHAHSRLWMRAGLAGALFTVASAGSCSVSYKSCTSHDPDNPCHEQHGDDTGTGGGSGGGFGLGAGEPDSGHRGPGVPRPSGPALHSGSDRSGSDGRVGTSGGTEHEPPWSTGIAPFAFWLARAAVEIQRRPTLAEALEGPVQVEVRMGLAGDRGSVAVVYGLADGRELALGFDRATADWLGACFVSPPQRQASSAPASVDQSSRK